TLSCSRRIEMAGLLDIITGGMTPNAYVGQNFPSMPSAIEGGNDPMEALRKLLLQSGAPSPAQAPALPFAPEATPMDLPPALTDASASRRGPAGPSIDDTVLNGVHGAGAPLNILPDGAGTPTASGSRNLLSDGLL